MTRSPSSTFAIHQAARANIGLIVAVVGGTITEGNENGESRAK